MSEPILRLIANMEEAYNGGDVSRFLSAFAPDAIVYDPSLPEPVRGRAAIQDWFAKGHSIFPDVKLERVRAFAEGEFASVEYVETGTHKGPFPGPGGSTVPPTGKAYLNREGSVFRVVDGKIVEWRLYWDVLGVMAQLGLTG